MARHSLHLFAASSYVVLYWTALLGDSHVQLEELSPAFSFPHLEPTSTRVSSCKGLTWRCTLYTAK